MKHRNIGTKLQFLYLVKVKIVSAHAVMLQRFALQVPDEICPSINKGVYGNEREILLKFGHRKGILGLSSDYKARVLIIIIIVITIYK